MRGGDVHRDLAAECDELVGLPRRLEADNDADLAEPITDRVVHVAADRALRHGNLGGAAQGHVLADGRNSRTDRVVRGDTADLRRLDLLDIGSGVERNVGDHPHESLELLVAGDEIGLRIDLDDDTFRALYGDADETFRGDTAGLFRHLGQALLAKPIDRAREITIGFDERRLAIHHAGVGLVAEFLDQLSGDICHRQNPVFVGRNALPPPRRGGGRAPETASARLVPERRYSALSSLAWAIQLSTRPGRPTSSPIWCVAAGP